MGDAVTGARDDVTRLLVATTNPGKQREYRRLLAPLPLEVVLPADVRLDLDVAESGATFAANATLKARAFAAASGLVALADDSGLEVDALGGRPGVRSSRWVPGGDADRIAALLALLAGLPPARRTARFRAVAALAWPDGRVVTAEGTVAGRIALAPRGTGGFGYDPVFVVEDGDHAGDRTMAELADREKDVIGHRARAVRGLWRRLRELAGEAPPLPARPPTCAEGDRGVRRSGPRTPTGRPSRPR